MIPEPREGSLLRSGAHIGTMRLISGRVIGKSTSWIVLGR